MNKQPHCKGAELKSKFSLKLAQLNWPGSRAPLLDFAKSIHINYFYDSSVRSKPSRVLGRTKGPRPACILFGLNSISVRGKRENVHSDEAACRVAKPGSLGILIQTTAKGKSKSFSQLFFAFDQLYINENKQTH